MSALPDASWRCPSCGADVTTPFCGACGEQRLAPDARSLRHYAATAVESLFSLDGRVLGTLVSFVRRPGELSAAYLEGRRKPFLNPLQLFLLVNAVYFLQAEWSGWNTYSTPWVIHVKMSSYAEVAQRIARFRLDQLGIPYEGPALVAFVGRFNEAARLIAKSLLILLVPLVTLLLALVRLGRPWQAAVHLTAGFHVTAYLITLQLFILPMGSALRVVAQRLGHPLHYATLDTILTWAINIPLAILCVPLFERVYGSPRRWAVVQAAVTGYFIFDCVQLYRIPLFFVTLFTTR